MLQPGDQYGIEVQQLKTATGLRTSVAINPSQKNMISMFPPRHSKLLSDTQQALCRDQDLYGILKADHSPVGRKNSVTNTEKQLLGRPRTRHNEIDSSGSAMHFRLNHLKSKHTYKDLPEMTDHKQKVAWKASGDAVRQSGFLTSQQMDQFDKKELEVLATKSGNNWNHTSKATQRVGFLIDADCQAT